jgi:hypothetical protein
MTLQAFPRAVLGKTYETTLSVGVAAGSFTNCILRMKIKRRASDPDSAALVALDNADLGGLSVVGGGTSILITIRDSVMASFLPVAGDTLSAGISVETPDGKTWPIKDLSPDFFVDPHPVHQYAP